MPSYSSSISNLMSCARHLSLGTAAAAMSVQRTRIFLSVNTRGVSPAHGVSCDAEKVVTMQKLCTDEQWLTRHWASLKEQRVTSTNGRKSSQSLQLMLKLRYRNYNSCTQSKRQSKSSNLKTFSAANDHSCILDWSIQIEHPEGLCPRGQVRGGLQQNHGVSARR